MSDPLATLSPSQRRDVRACLIAATARAGRPDLDLPVGELVAGVDADALIEASLLHRVSGTLYAGLCGIDIPGEMKATLHQYREDGGLAHLIKVGALSEIANAFDERGLRWVAMKGPILATVLYDHPGDRTYGDIDLLVHPLDYPAAVDALERLAYDHDVHDWARAEHVMAGQLGMTRPGMDVDLHWQLHYSTADRRPYRIDPRRMLARAERITVSGLDVPALDAADRLVAVAFHAARSGGHRLLWLKDIERCLSVERPTEDLIVERSHETGLAATVGFMLERTRRVLHAPVSDDLLRRLVPAGLQRMQRVIERASHPVQLHERDTVSRLASRSVRATLPRSLATVPSRMATRIGDALPRRENETDDPVEKARYLAAVAAWEMP